MRTVGSAGRMMALILADVDDQIATHQVSTLRMFK